MNNMKLLYEKLNNAKKKKYIFSIYKFKELFIEFILFISGLLTSISEERCF